MTTINGISARASERNCNVQHSAIATVQQPGVIIKTCIALLTMLGVSLMESCLDPYSPPASASNANYLVVDGFLNNETAPTVIRLSRTIPLISGDVLVPERHAIVLIEDDQGGKFTLTETDSGSYSGLPLFIDPVKNYRLKIKTSSSKEYESDFVMFKPTPVIDSITWDVDGSDVHIYANAHDENNSTRYYFWKYEETWAYTSRYPSGYKYEDGQIVDRHEDIYHCWKTLPSTQIQITSSTKLERDVISNYKLVTLPLTSEKFQSKYSMLLHQFALTKEAFEYWQQLKKNTENIGTIFGPQPSQVASNIRCTTNPMEPVVGYFSAGSIQEKRIFIPKVELPSSTNVTGYEACEVDTLKIADIPDFRGTELLISTLSKGAPPVLIGYSMSSYFCVDCRYHGGTTVMPDFWK